MGLRKLRVLLLSLGLAGCAVPGTLQKMAIDQNEVVARTADSLALLNILRAKEGRPLHFTTVSRISGNYDLSASGALSGSVGFAGADAVNLSPALGGAIATNPNFDTTILDSQEFQRGIMQPVSPDTLNYFLRTGWRPDLLTYLLVERVDFIAEGPTQIGGRRFVDGEVIASLVNSPVHKDAAQFRAFVACYVLAASQRKGDSLPLKKFDDLAGVRLPDLALLDGNKFDLGRGPAGSGDKEDWVVRRSPGGQAVGLKRRAETSCSGDGLSARLAGGEKITARIDPGVASIDPRKNNRLEVKLDDGRTVTISIDLTFRSVEGIVYFLGEYARASESAPLRPIYPIPAELDGSGAPQDLFLIAAGRGGRHDLSATINGQAWHIPEDCRCRSYRVITLLEQLVNLHKVGGNAPLSTAVRVIR